MSLRRQHLWAAVLLVAVAMRFASEQTANLSYLVIAAYALLGRAHAIQALVLSWLFTMLNPGLAPEATVASVGRYAVLAVAALTVLRLSFFTRKDRRLNYMVFATLILGVFLIIHSFIFSPIVDVSALKAVSWTLVMTTLISAWTGLAPDERDSLIQQIFAGLVAIMLVSLPLLVMPVGYLRNGTGFQGIFGQPQAFGPTMALLGTWAASHVFQQKRPPWSAVALTLGCMVLVILSEARTAGLSLVLGVGIAVVMAPTLSGQPLRTALPGFRSPRIFFVGFISVAVILIAGPFLSDRIGSYIAKRGEADNLVEAYETSRGGLMQRMLVNIEAKPLEGIGFGIASNPELMDVQRDPVLGLPLKATIEKGVLPLAVLEELGVFGFLMVAAWIGMLLRRGARGGVVPLAVTTTALLINMGESILFSAGGLGLLPLILFGWAFSCGSARRTNRQTAESRRRSQEARFSDPDQPDANSERGAGQRNHRLYRIATHG